MASEHINGTTCCRKITLRFRNTEYECIVIALKTQTTRAILEYLTATVFKTTIPLSEISHHTTPLTAFDEKAMRLPWHDTIAKNTALN